MIFLCEFLLINANWWFEISENLCEFADGFWVLRKSYSIQMCSCDSGWP